MGQWSLTAHLYLAHLATCSNNAAKASRNVLRLQVSEAETHGTPMLHVLTEVTVAGTKLATQWAVTSNLCAHD